MILCMFKIPCMNVVNMHTHMPGFVTGDMLRFKQDIVCEECQNAINS